MLVLISFKITPHLSSPVIHYLIVWKISSEYFFGQFVFNSLKIFRIKKVIVGDNCFRVYAKQALFDSQLTILTIFVINRGDKILVSLKKFILTKIELSFLLFFNFSEFQNRRASCFGDFYQFFVLESRSLRKMEKAFGRDKLSTFAIFVFLFLFHFNTESGLNFRQRYLLGYLVLGLGKKS